MFMQIAQFKKCFRSLVLLGISLFFLIYTDILFWVPCLLLAVFFFSVDVLNVGKSDSSNGCATEEFSRYKPGVLDHYDIDSDNCYGLFVVIGGKHVFVDLREDHYIDDREKFARYLYKNSDELEKNLAEFVKLHPEFSSRQINSIGLHSDTLDQGEVFWTPDGYTGLKGVEFRV
jgi:hypothetical protein